MYYLAMFSAKFTVFLSKGRPYLTVYAWTTESTVKLKRKFIRKRTITFSPCNRRLERDVRARARAIRPVDRSLIRGSLIQMAPHNNSPNTTRLRSFHVAKVTSRCAHLARLYTLEIAKSRRCREDTVVVVVVVTFAYVAAVPVSSRLFQSFRLFQLEPGATRFSSPSWNTSHGHRGETVLI